MMQNHKYHFHSHITLTPLSLVTDTSQLLSQFFKNFKRPSAHFVPTLSTPSHNARPTIIPPKNMLPLVL